MVKEERSRGIPSQGRGERFSPLFPPQIHGFGVGIGGAATGGGGSGGGEVGGQERNKGSEGATVGPPLLRQAGGAARLPHCCM
jgi:hypothetical protein